MAARRLLTLMAATGACAFMAPPSSPPGLVASPRLLSAPSSFRGYRRNAAGGLRMGGSNVPRVPYKAPGDQVYQFMDIWNRMYRERILYIGQDLDDEFANQMIAVLLWLNNEDATQGVQLYFNCPGGEVRAGLAVYDTMNNMDFDISTLNLGIAASISAFLCGAGKKGQRMALPNARFLLQNPKLEDMGLSQVLYGQASDVSIEATEILRMREKVFKGLSRFTGRKYEDIRKDLTRDLYLTAPEAVEYGLIDKVLLPLQRTQQDVKKYIGNDNRNFGKI